MEDLRNVVLRTALIHQDQLCIQPLCVGARQPSASHVRSNNGNVLQMLLPQRAHQHSGGVEMVHGDIEEALNLRRVQVHRDDSVSPGSGDEVGNQLCRNRDARLILAVLSSVAEVGNHRRNPAR
jgi:hypothetical protein